MPIPSNPYGADWKNLKVVQGRVNPTDFAFVESLCPFTNGLQDRIISTLYHKFISELRSINADTIARTGRPIEPALYSGDPANDVIANLLDRCNFRTSPPVPETPARDVSRGTDRVHKKVRPAPAVRTDPKGSPRKGSAKPRGKEKGKGPTRDGDGSSPGKETLTGIPALDKLKQEGIL